MIPLHDINPRRHGPPLIVIALIAANTLFFLYELTLGETRLESFLLAAAFIPGRLLADGLSAGDLAAGAQSAFLSMFLHGGWAHFLGNMLFLWVFGDNVEDELGHVRFLFLYLAAGYVATIAHAWANPLSALPAIGASGAISGVLGAYLFAHPRARIVTVLILGFFIRFIQVPAWVYLPFWFLLQLLPGLASLGAPTAAEQGGVAWFAHIGGFIAGPVLRLLLGGGRRAPSRGPRRAL
ncbi:MAG TPA: rhomboid family intramembrane serine protease [Thermoanaerobaculia bacterium]|nr:rhomboid family intramembrane serine protease [Thermoanaerobaculia bacterium]